MGTSDNGQEVLRQNLEEKGTFQALYQMHLLFREKGKRPEGKKILGRLQKEFGQVDLVADVDHSLATFAIADFPVEYKKDKKVIPGKQRNGNQLYQLLPLCYLAIDIGDNRQHFFPQGSPCVILIHCDLPFCLRKERKQAACLFLLPSGLSVPVPCQRGGLAHIHRWSCRNTPA